MKKCKKIKAPKYSYGAMEVLNATDVQMQNAAEMLNLNLDKSAISKDFGEQTVKIGGAIPGVWGKAISAAGATLSQMTTLIGTKGSVNPYTGLVSRGKGILGRLNRDKLKLEAGIVANNLAAQLNSANYANQWYSQHGYEPVNVAKGGVIPNTMAYLDDGEWGLTPDGLEFKVPELGKPTDSNLVSVPVGTSILSDVKKPKGSKDTYAKIYEKNKAKTNMKGNDIYARNSKMLNDMYNKNLHNSILAMLESNKKSNSKAGKYKDGTPYVSAGGRKKVPILYIYDKTFDKFGYYDPNTGGFVDMSDVANDRLPDSVYTDRPFHYDRENNLIIDSKPYMGDDIYEEPKNSERFNFTKFIRSFGNGDDWKAERNKQYKEELKQRKIKDDERKKLRLSWSKYENSKPKETYLDKVDNSKKEVNNFDIHSVSNMSYIMYDFWKNLESRKKILPSENLLLPEGNWKQLYRAQWQGGDNNQGFEFQRLPKSEKLEPKVEPTVSTTETKVVSQPEQNTNKSQTKNTNSVSTASKTNTPLTNSVNNEIATKKFDPTAEIKAKTLAEEYNAVRKDFAKPNIYAPIQKPYSDLRTPVTNGTQGNKFKWLDAVSNLAGLFGPLSNMFTLKGASDPAFMFTPAFGPNNYNINPLLRNIDETYAMANYNMGNLNPQTGANMAFGILNAINRDKQIANAFGTKNNLENQMYALNADRYNLAAQYNSQSLERAADRYARDVAAVSDIRRRGLSDLSTALQTMNRDRRLTERDKLIAKAGMPFMNYAMSDDFMKAYNDYLRRIG